MSSSLTTSTDGSVLASSAGATVCSRRARSRLQAMTTFRANRPLPATSNRAPESFGTERNRRGRDRLPRRAHHAGVGHRDDDQLTEALDADRVGDGVLAGQEYGIQRHRTASAKADLAPGGPDLLAAAVCVACVYSDGDGFNDAVLVPDTPKSTFCRSHLSCKTSMSWPSGYGRAGAVVVGPVGCCGDCCVDGPWKFGPPGPNGGRKPSPGPSNWPRGPPGCIISKP
jgi:hypothetical protein